MDINSVTQLISTVGFPICVSLICFWYIAKQNDNHKEEIDALKDSLVTIKEALAEIKAFMQLISKGGVN